MKVVSILGYVVSLSKKIKKQPSYKEGCGPVQNG